MSKKLTLSIAGFLGVFVLSFLVSATPAQAVPGYMTTRITACTFGTGPGPACWNYASLSNISVQAGGSVYVNLYSRWVNPSGNSYTIPGIGTFGDTIMDWGYTMPSGWMGYMQPYYGYGVPPYTVSGQTLTNFMRWDSVANLDYGSTVTFNVPSGASAGTYPVTFATWEDPNMGSYIGYPPAIPPNSACQWESTFSCLNPSTATLNITVTTPPVAGTCGTANGQIYSNATSSYGSDTQCATGNTTNGAFPAQGSSTSWQCTGTSGGATSGVCSASRSGATSGTLTSSANSCLIAIGASTCNVDLTWTTTNPVTTSTITSPAGTLATANSGTATVAVPYAATVEYFLKNNALTLAQKLIFPSCTSGSTWNGSICQANAVNGVCGTADGKTYPNSTSAYAPDTQCSTGTSTNTAFPAQGSSATWNCNGSNGGTNSLTCIASRTGAPVAGACGDASGKTYANGTTAYAPDVQCFTGTSSNTAFPTVGTPVSWSCGGINGGASSGACSAASQASPSQADLTAGATSPSTATAGVAQTFSASISNIGNASTGSSFSNFFQVATAGNGGGTVTDLTSSSMSTLAMATSATATSPSYGFGSSGTYSVRACADKTNSASSGSITESDETNNCGAWTNITVSNMPVPVVSISATPTSGTSGTVNPTITWSSTNSPTACTASGDWSGSQSSSGSQAQGILSSARTYTYTLTCSNAGGAGTPQSAIVVVSVPTTATLNASSTSIYSGDPTTLTWSSNAASCVGTPTDFTGGAPSNSTGVVLTPTATTSYQVTCGGIPSNVVTVTVKKKPIIIEN